MKELKFEMKLVKILELLHEQKTRVLEEKPILYTTLSDIYQRVEILYDTINSRVDVMISNGLEEEAFKLQKHSKLNTLNTVGYKEFFDYFENKLSYDEAIDKIKQNTRNYAKRQITWLKKYKNSKKINIEKINEIDLNKIS